MNSELYPIGTFGNGRLYAMPMPSPNHLTSVIADLQRKGIDRLVCLQQTKESLSLGLQDEQTACESARIAFSRLQIPDFGVPRFTDLQALIELLIQELEAGRSIAVHCRGGIGRTGLVCCCILTAFGMDTIGAMNCVSERRGCAVPETDAQRAMIEQFAQTINS